MRTFKLVRTEDVSGVSGTGEVAEGVEFHDGQVVMSWFGQLHTLEVSPNIEAIERIHGHSGKTKVVWDDEVVVCVCRHPPHEKNRCGYCECGVFAPKQVLSHV